MIKRKSKNIENKSELSAALVVWNNNFAGLKEPNTVGVVIEDVCNSLDGDTLQLEMSKQQAMQLASDLIQAVFADRYNLDSKRAKFDEVGYFEPIYIGRKLTDAALLGFSFAPNLEILKKVETSGSDISYIASREDYLRLIRLLIKSINETIKD